MRPFGNHYGNLLPPAQKVSLGKDAFWVQGVILSDFVLCHRPAGQVL